METKTGNINVLVTRPEHQADKLCELIEKLGDTAIRFPVIEISQSENQQAAKNILENIEQYDIGIFISRNAVEWTLKLLNDKASALKRLSLFSIGPATTEALKKAFSGNVTSNNGSNSEALLELEPLHSELVSGKNIIIFRGQGGREHLARTLTQRGATVDFVEVYRRECPQYDSDYINEIWTLNVPDIVIVTSNNSLENLFFLLNNEQRNLLLSKQLIVISQRVLDFSVGYGFAKTPIVTEESSDEGILNAIIKWKESLT